MYLREINVLGLKATEKNICLYIYDIVYIYIKWNASCYAMFGNIAIEKTEKRNWNDFDLMSIECYNFWLLLSSKIMCLKDI